MIVALLLACSAGTSPPPPPRVEAVVAPAPRAADPATFCERRSGPADAPLLRYPPLDGAAAPPPGERWTWLNVWASWCGPCLEEMPRLAAWAPRLAEETGPGALRFLSVDADPSALRRLLARRPDLPRGPRIAGEEHLEPWLASLGLDASTVLPLHLFADAAGRVRCIRMGAVGEDDYPTVAALLGGRWPR